jgi:hypothetical protein
MPQYFCKRWHPGKKTGNDSAPYYNLEVPSKVFELGYGTFADVFSSGIFIQRRIPEGAANFLAISFWFLFFWFSNRKLSDYGF